MALEGLDTVIASALAAASYLILRRNPHGLTVDEIAAIRVHTSPHWASYESSVCYAVNRALESGDKEAISKFALYIQLLMSAIGKFGGHRAVVSRRLKGETDAYKVGQDVVWTGFGSAQAQVADEDCVEDGAGGDASQQERVDIVVDCVCADVSELCSARQAGECLIAPGMRLRVQSKRRIGRRLLIVLSQQ